MLHYFFSFFLFLGVVMANDLNDKKILSVEKDLALLKDKLSPKEFDVMCNEGTEPPFKNEYWDNKKEGIYIDKISGKALFSSLDKYDSGTGWPSFTQPLDQKNVQFKVDKKMGSERIEVKSSSSKAHLGHVFEDGPKDKGGKRFCMNSASLRFIAKDKLKDEGYGEFLSLFPANMSENKVKLEEAIFGGGCFWGVEDLLKKLPGVVETDVGYAGGSLKNPTYNDVKKGNTGHAEVVLVKFDPAKIKYGQVLDYFFKLHDPTTKNKQGNDEGTQYRSVIFAFNDQQKNEAEAAIKRAGQSGRWKNPVVTEVKGPGHFYKAEEYHQDYLSKTPNGYTCHFLRE